MVIRSVRIGERECDELQELIYYQTEMPKPWKSKNLKREQNP